MKSLTGFGVAVVCLFSTEVGRLPRLAQSIERYLLSCAELTAFCSQNGWIDNETFYYEIIEQNDAAITVLVQFEEILMEGAGLIASRIPCHGRLRLALNRYGEVAYAQLL